MVEQLLPTPEVSGSNPVICQLFMPNLSWGDENKEKEAGNGPIKSPIYSTAWILGTASVALLHKGAFIESFFKMLSSNCPKTCFHFTLKKGARKYVPLWVAVFFFAPFSIWGRANRLSMIDVVVDLFERTDRRLMRPDSCLSPVFRLVNQKTSSRFVTDKSSGQWKLFHNVIGSWGWPMMVGYPGYWGE